jgi:lysophospholipase L1-like esterase
MPAIDQLIEGFLFPVTWVSYAVFLSSLTLGLILLIVFAQLFNKRPQKQNFTILFISLFVALASVEGVLVYAGYMSTYLEERGLGRPLDMEYFSSKSRTREPNSNYFFSTDAYSFERTTNELGFSDKSWGDKDSTFRIIALGDSFTEGDGTSMDSTWVSLSERMFQQAGINLKILNSGTSGSDPYEELQKFNKTLSNLDPDLVVLAVSTLDFTDDCQIRGGMERFNNLGVHISISELIYAFSRIGRMVYSKLGYNDQLMQTRDTIHIKKEAQRHVVDIVEAYSAIDSIPIYVLFFPLYDEVRQSYAYSLNETLSKACSEDPNIQYFDLQDCYQKTMASRGLTPEDIWWVPIDGHHKPRGYAMMADCIYENIRLDLEQIISNQENIN